MKRSFDVLVSAVALLVLSPLLALIALAVAITMGRPVLFRQQRAGLHGKPFAIVKFRTMAETKTADGGLLPDADRLTRFGSFLRSTSLDELPELWNVLRGHMSIVGPRPLHVRYLERYPSHHARRHDIRPGITGWAQVNGRNTSAWHERLNLDVWYVENRSALLDLRILLRTVHRVLKRSGITHTATQSMPEYQGSN